ncbi:hypothetical protein B843_00875 [Corynebacterium vitaeruminis DSM 20294]|uniref:Uncharacterized protein n=1 Tax=Corynebacterium vitaeruminis DSM 20294 TaxID=1224164 RepID=W5XX30_9CORY|nr:hypothetical protein B843_00875 [Corynebacterium vitaeruminis DSM 20294]
MIVGLLLEQSLAFTFHFSLSFCFFAELSSFFTFGFFCSSLGLEMQCCKFELAYAQLVVFIGDSETDH